jgi:hypothetical protein
VFLRWKGDSSKSCYWWDHLISFFSVTWCNFDVTLAICGYHLSNLWCGQRRHL